MTFSHINYNWVIHTCSVRTRERNRNILLKGDDDLHRLEYVYKLWKWLSSPSIITITVLLTRQLFQGCRKVRSSWALVGASEWITQGGQSVFILHTKWSGNWIALLHLMPQIWCFKDLKKSKASLLWTVAFCSWYLCPYISSMCMYCM